ncbi:two-component system response regulator NarL [Acidiferrobacter sp.]|uniref:two-component system response regulator NarL n=1 Tax=Acidiferrobacter sp. TaxID=1872107 RepID=UPI00262BCEDB|nr:two-component system response regulator NarL [Acidiferrobacter sp.]
MTGRHGVLVVDDHPLVRKGIAQLLAMDPGLTLVGEARDQAEALAAAARLKPALVLLDLNLAGVSGLETLRALRAGFPGVSVLILTVSDAEEDLMAALKAGATGYLLKDMEPEEILREIRRALQGDMVLSPRLAPVLARALRPGSRCVPGDGRLMTGRERQIVRRVAQGKSNKLVARELGIAEGTVKVHIKRILRKLALHSRVDIAVWAVDHGCRDVIAGVVPGDRSTDGGLPE